MKKFPFTILLGSFVIGFLVNHYILFPSHITWKSYIFPNAEPSDDRIWQDSDIVATKEFETLHECAQYGLSFHTYYYECDKIIDSKESRIFEFQPEWPYLPVCSLTQGYLTSASCEREYKNKFKQGYAPYQLVFPPNYD